MNATDLLEETQLAFATDQELGDSKVIEYRYKSGLVISDATAFVETGIFNKDKSQTLQNLQEFHSVSLPSKPSKDDTILYNGIVHEIEDWELIGSLWSIYTKTSRHRGR